MNKKIKKEIKIVGINELKPYSKNPRRNNKSSKIVAGSIKQYGYISPIIVSEDLIILAGHTRLKALKLLKYKKVEVLVVYGLTKRQIDGFVIADNRVGEYSQWNYSQIDRLMTENEPDEFINTLGITSFKKNKSELENLIDE